MSELFHKELSFEINGLLFKTHNELGRFCRERQYGDFFEGLLKEKSFTYEREKEIPISGINSLYTNKVDFLIEGKVLIDFKAKPLVTKEDYYQMNRYLNASGLKLGLIVNFRNTYLKPIRVVRAGS